jgi:DNA-binding CsgD family transcriptional regulator
MRTSRDLRIAHWLEVVGEILQQPLTRWPHETLSSELLATFDARTVSWHRRQPGGREELAGWCGDRGGLDVSTVQGWLDTLLDRHPLMQWYTTVLDIRPQTMNRVPLKVSPLRNREMVYELVRPLGAEHQLALELTTPGVEHRAFIVARGGTDFTDEELELAGGIQQLLIGLDKQLNLYNDARGPVDLGAPSQVGLTGRELAVLTLLADSYTAGHIAHCLGVSQRTVHKHLEHVYRKLDVPDRLSAVRQGEALGLVRPLTCKPS